MCTSIQNSILAQYSGFTVKVFYEERKRTKNLIKVGITGENA